MFSLRSVLGAHVKSCPMQWFLRNAVVPHTQMTDFVASAHTKELRMECNARVMSIQRSWLRFPLLRNHAAYVMLLHIDEHVDKLS